MATIPRRVTECVNNARRVGEAVLRQYVTADAGVDQDTAIARTRDIVSSLEHLGRRIDQAEIERLLGRFRRPRGAVKLTGTPLVPHPLHIGIALCGPGSADPLSGLFIELMSELVRRGFATRHGESRQQVSEQIQGHAYRWARSMDVASESQAGRLMTEWAAVRGYLGVELTKAPTGLLGWPCQRIPWLPPSSRELSRTLNELLGHVPSVQGLADVLDGGFAPAPSGGLVSLLSGRAGSGKTSLACALSASILLSGGHALYLAFEEMPRNIEQRILGQFHALGGMESAAKSALRVVNPVDLVGGVGMDTELTQRFINPLLQSVQADGAQGTAVCPFSLCIVIDSLDALETRDGWSGRSQLEHLISPLRSRGVFVLLIAGGGRRQPEGYEAEAHAKKLTPFKSLSDLSAIDYLVDNVFHLDRADDDHSLLIDKSRHQSARSGKHGLSARGPEGVRVYPSISSYWSWLNTRASIAGRPGKHALGHITDDETVRAHPSYRDGGPSWTALGLIRAGGHVAVLGKGSTGKSEYALRLLLSKRVLERDVEDGSIPPPPMARRSSRGSHGLDVVGDRAPQGDPDARVLVVPFSNDRDWYLATANKLRNQFFGSEPPPATDLISVLRLYPGVSLTPPILIRKIERQLETGLRSDRAFTGVLIDALHNVALAYPSLEDQIDVWQAVYALIRSYGATCVSTFTAFDLARSDHLWDDMLTPSTSSQMLAQILAARADASVFFRRATSRATPW